MPRADLIPRSVLFGAAERNMVRISPDGKHLAWLAPKDGVVNIWVAPIAALDRAVAVTNETGRPIRGYSWSFISKHLLYGQDAGGDENFHIFRVDLADNKTTDRTPYKGARALLVGQSARQPHHVMVAVNDRDPKAYDLYKVDVLTGVRTLVAQTTSCSARSASTPTISTPQRNTSGVIAKPVSVA